MPQIASKRGKGRGMAALNQILFPGERLVARYFPMGLIRGWFVIAGALPVLATAAVWHRTGFADGELEWLLYVDGGFVLYLLLTTYYLGRWRLVVTEQRLLIREGAEYQEVQLDLIREVRYAGHTLTVRATDRTVETSILIPFARRIVRAIDPALETSGAPALKLAALIHPDETVLYRDPTTWSIKANLALLAAASAAAPVMVGYMKGFGDGFDWFTLGMFYAGLVPMAFQWKRHFGWKVAITGRRLLVRRHHDPDRYDEIALADILSAEPGEKGKNLSIRTAAQTLDITAGKRKAARILDAIEAARETSA
jgi:hypothetical protein